MKKEEFKWNLVVKVSKDPGIGEPEPRASREKQGNQPGMDSWLQIYLENLVKAEL